MKDSTLLLCALAVSVAGIIGLFFLSNSEEIAEVSLRQAKLLESYDEVHVQGTVNSVHKSENVTILMVTQLEEMKAVVFDEVNVSEGSLIQLYGQVKEYEGDKEIVVERMRIVG